MFNSDRIRPTAHPRSCIMMNILYSLDESQPAPAEKKRTETTALKPFSMG